MQNANIFGQCRLFAHFGVWPWFMKKFSWYYASERGWWTQDSRIESCSSWDELVSAVVVVSMICSGHQPRHDNLCWRRLHSSSHSFFVSNCSTNNTRVTQIFSKRTVFIISFIAVFIYFDVCLVNCEHTVVRVLMPPVRLNWRHWNLCMRLKPVVMTVMMLQMMIAAARLWPRWSISIDVSTTDCNQHWQVSIRHHPWISF